MLEYLAPDGRSSSDLRNMRCLLYGRVQPTSDESLYRFRRRSKEKDSDIDDDDDDDDAQLPAAAPSQRKRSVRMKRGANMNEARAFGASQCSARCPRGPLGGAWLRPLKRYAPADSAEYGPSRLTWLQRCLRVDGAGRCTPAPGLRCNLLSLTFPFFPSARVGYSERAGDVRSRFELFGAPVAPKSPRAERRRGARAEAASATYARALRQAQAGRVRKLCAAPAAAAAAASGGGGGVGGGGGGVAEAAVARGPLHGVLLDLGVLEMLGLEDALHLCEASACSPSRVLPLAVLLWRVLLGCCPSRGAARVLIACCT